jgi:hypothetical protein
MKYTTNAKKQLLHDILEICHLLEQTEQYQILPNQIIGLIDQKNKGDDFIREILMLIKVVAGCDAVGIRFREGEDFPYYETIGFEEDFMKTLYESVALIPLRYENKLIGFLQLHDRRKDAFTPELRCLFERIGTGIAKNVSSNQAEDMHFLHGTNIMDETIITFHDENFNIISANKAAKEILGLPPLDGAEAKCYTYYHGKDCPPPNCPSCKCLLSRDPVTFEMFEPHLKRRIKVSAFPRFDKNDKFIGLIHYVRAFSKERIDSDKFRE